MATAKVFLASLVLTILRSYHLFELLEAQVSITVLIKSLNYCRRIPIYLLLMEFLSKIGLSNESFVVLIEHSKCFTHSK